MSAADEWDRCVMCGAEVYENHLDGGRLYHRHGKPWCYPEDINNPTAATLRIPSGIVVDPTPSIAVISDVLAERLRQDLKWGEQNHPNVDPALIEYQASLSRVAEDYEIPTADRAKALCQLAASGRGCTWAHILIEEVAEAIEAAAIHDKAVHADAVLAPGLRMALRDELIQVAAVAVQWAEKLGGAK